MKPKKFLLPYTTFQNDMIGLLDSKTVVISFFGMSSYYLMSCKAGLVDELLGYHVFKTSPDDNLNVDRDVMNLIEGCYSSTLKVLFLHLRGMFDTHTLIEQYQHFKQEMNEKGYLNVWAQLKHSYARALLFLFSISHVLIVNHPSPCLDISYIHLFRALDTVRLKLQPSISEVLAKIPGVSSEWITNGRFCSPRVLWLFENCPPVFRKEISRKLGIDWTKEDLKKVGHDLEDQIYSILRKSRVITNISTNSLFAIPPNKEYVFIITEPDVTQDWTPYLVNTMVNLCKNTHLSLEQNHCSYGYESLADPHIYTQEQRFQLFLQQHIDQAFSQNGFEDNTGRHIHSINPFETPQLRVILEASNALYSMMVCGSVCDPVLTTLHNLLDTDIKFSEARCSKVLPLAIATYQENLPTNYTKEYHLNKVSLALGVFGEYARGPLVESYINQLEKECERHWKSGRQMCEVLSMTGNPCTKPLHKGGSGELSTVQFDSTSHVDLPVMEHCSGVRYISACDCGRKQGPREDPFYVRAANYDFYQLLGAECGCDSLDRIHFPVFQPSTQDYRAATLFSNMATRHVNKDSALIHNPIKELGTQPCNTQGLSLAYVSLQSGGDNSDMLLCEGNISTNQQRASATSLTEGHQIVIQVSDVELDSNKEKNLVRQPSTTEYLPGMLHSESPSSLLPQFPSWSLVCLGPSSLYSHNLGLQEQQQAGLLGGSAYLLPWDVIVRLEQSQKDRFWPTVGEQTNSNRHKPGQAVSLSKGRKTKGSKDLSEFNVKIFVGVEYECPRGHRFMCSAPDKVLKTSGTGLVKDNGNKVTGCDMPLYFPCPCRSTKPLTAQLMRIHVVTPKAPVHVTLNPRVQPAPNLCPVFITGCQEPLRLSQSAYWVLRLPYVYVGDHGPYLPPKDPILPNYGRLLAGMYGISEITDAKL